LKYLPEPPAFAPWHDGGTSIALCRSREIRKAEGARHIFSTETRLRDINTRRISAAPSETSKAPR